MHLDYKCSERNRTCKNFCCDGTVVTVATNAYLFNSVNWRSIKISFHKISLILWNLSLNQESMSFVTSKLFTFLSFCPQNLVFKGKFEQGSLMLCLWRFATQKRPKCWMLISQSKSFLLFDCIMREFNVTLLMQAKPKWKPNLTVLIPFLVICFW